MLWGEKREKLGTVNLEKCIHLLNPLNLFVSHGVAKAFLLGEAGTPFSHSHYRDT